MASQHFPPADLDRLVAKTGIERVEFHEECDSTNSLAMELARKGEVGPLVVLTERQTAEAAKREARFRGPHGPIELRGRTVILVDDGLATGATMRAAARAVRGREPARLIIAVPVGAREAVAALAEDADRVVCPAQPEPFIAIGLHYEDFGQVEDEEVLALLQRMRG